MAETGDFASRWKAARKGRAGKSPGAAIAEPDRLTSGRPLEGRRAALSDRGGEESQAGEDDTLPKVATPRSGRC